MTSFAHWLDRVPQSLRKPSHKIAYAFSSLNCAGIGCSEKPLDRVWFAESIVKAGKECEKAWLPFLVVEDEFMVASQGLAKWDHFVSGSVHGLLMSIVHVKANRVLGSVAEAKYGDPCKDRLVTPKSVVQHYDIASAALRESLPPIQDDASRFLAGIKAELARAADRRLITNRSYPTDELPAPVPDIPFPPDDGRRPAYGRDHKWLEWVKTAGLTPAKIRDRWDELPEEERQQICPNACHQIGGASSQEKISGREIVKTAIKKAKKERKM